LQACSGAVEGQSLELQGVPLGEADSSLVLLLTAIGYRRLDCNCHFSMELFASAQQQQLVAHSQLNNNAPNAAPIDALLIFAAAMMLLQRSGSSLPAIKKVIGDKYKGKLPTGWERMTSQQLKRLSDKGELVKVKASYKLGEVRCRAQLVLICYHADLCMLPWA
jgi:hypothetical protein